VKRVSIPELINCYIFRFFNFKIEKINRTFEYKRSRLISVIKPDLVIDGGANIGQWALELDKKHPKLKIWSFEPLQDSRNLLESRANVRSTEWKVFPFALGKKDGRRQMNIASNQQMSSSFLIPSFHTRLRPDILFTKTEEVSVIALDTIKDQLNEFQSIFLKLDVQGSEMDAILGALNILKKVSIIEIESSFTPLYDGETAHHELIAKIKSLGFTPFFITVPHAEPSGRQYALDTILINDDLLYLL